MKRVNKFKALVAKKRVTIREIFKFSKEIYPKMVEDMKKNNLEAIDNTVFISHGRDGNLKKKFDHEICIPINDPEEYSGEFEIKEIHSFECISGKYKGTMNNILTNGI
ncbi:MAG: hypothetical protein ACQERZ_05335, partial [Fusobacteriota bacterium]